MGFNSAFKRLIENIHIYNETYEYHWPSHTTISSNAALAVTLLSLPDLQHDLTSVFFSLSVEYFEFRQTLVSVLFRFLSLFLLTNLKRAFRYINRLSGFPHGNFLCC
jgi:hypothetical protein